MLEKEIRSGVPIEFKEDEGGDVRVSGYAAVFDEETNIGGMFVEVIQRGAFEDAIGRDDVVFLINHEGLPLARTRSGTLNLAEDDHGLFMEALFQKCNVAIWIKCLLHLSQKFKAGTSLAMFQSVQFPKSNFTMFRLSPLQLMEALKSACVRLNLIVRKKPKRKHQGD